MTSAADGNPPDDAFASRWAVGAQAWKRLPHPIRWVTVAIIGLTLVILGVIFMVLPGPGIPLVILGLVVLASEFAWAERTLHRVRHDSGRLWSSLRNRVRRQSAPGERS